MTDTPDNSSAAPQAVIHVIDPERDKTFRALAATSGYLKAQSRNKILIQCTQCETKMEKPRKCSKVSSGNDLNTVVDIYRVSDVTLSVGAFCIAHKSAKRKTDRARPDRPTHKRICHQVEQSSGILKLVRMFSVNPLIMMYLKTAIVLDCNLLGNPRIGFDVPFVASVDIGLEPSDIFDFVGLYFNDKAVRDKLQGMVQVNSMTSWYPGMKGVEPLTPQRLNQWREARAKHDAEGYDKDPVGLLDFSSTALSRGATSVTYGISLGCHISDVIIEMAMEREPFVRVCPLAGTRFKQPMSPMTCLEYINAHIRADTQNQLRLRSEMTEQDQEVIRAAGRGEDQAPARVLKEKMEREILYRNIVGLGKGARSSETLREKRRRPRRIPCSLCGTWGCKGIAAPIPKPNVRLLVMDHGKE